MRRCRFAVACALCCAVFGRTPLPAQVTSPPVFADSDFSTWQLLVPPGDPGIELVRFDYGDPYLTVRHRHLDQFNSLKRSVQGSPRALYDPGASGAIDSFAFSGIFRPHFESEGPNGYSIRSIGLRPALLQGGELFVAEHDLFRWTMAEQALGQWAPGSSGSLGATSFFCNRTEEVFPDFSAAGGPIVLGFHLDSGFQTSSETLANVVAEMDVDDFRVEAVLVGADGLPTIRIESGFGIVGTGSQATAVFSGVESEFSGRFAVPIQLSAAADHPVRYRLRNRTGELSEWQRISPGVIHVSTLMSAERGAENWTLVDIEGALPGTPLRASLFIHDDHPEEETDVYDCAGEFISIIYRYIAGELHFPQPGAGSAAPKRMTVHGDEETEFLDTLRAFRDEVMAESVAGRYYTNLFRTWSPELVRAFHLRPLVMFDLYDSYGAWTDGLAALVEGSGAAFLVTADMAGDLNRILDTLEAGASPALARAIAFERARLGLSSITGLSMQAFWQRVVDRAHPDPCVADGDGLCIGGGNGGRYRVEADWRTTAGGVGRAHAVALTGDSGYFWFFDPANVELLTKIVDGCGFNQRTWSYSAGLTNLQVDLFVFDTATGRGKSYRNPQATNFAPLLDSDYLDCEPDPLAAEAAGPVAKSPANSPVRARAQPLGADSCVAGPETLCLGGGRFRVEADFRTAAGATGAAHAVPLTDDTGTFWFFNAANIELVVKTIDACGLAGFENYWVFAGGTTDVEVEMRVTDTERHVTKTYGRPLGAPFAPILDSAAFATCP